MFTTCNTWLYYTRLEFEKQKTRLNIQLEYSRNQLKKKLSKISTLKETIQKSAEDIDNLKKVINNEVSPHWNNDFRHWVHLCMLLSVTEGVGAQIWEVTWSKMGIVSWITRFGSGREGGRGHATEDWLVITWAVGR